ncbi:MAG: hypothetical protein ING19_00765 [Azospirillum sp.]|nr:hypothetical protein [Azospirillum sp.]
MSDAANATDRQSDDAVKTKMEIGAAIAIEGTGTEPGFFYVDSLIRSPIYALRIADLICARVVKKATKEKPWIDFRIWNENGSGAEALIRDFGDRLAVMKFDDAGARIPEESIGLATRLAGRIASAKGWLAVKIGIAAENRPETENFDANLNRDVAYLAIGLRKAGMKIVAPNLEEFDRDFEFEDRSDLVKDMKSPFWLRSDETSVDESLSKITLHFAAEGRAAAEREIAALAARAKPKIGPEI